jgi:PAS domain S-box-containing protein
MPMMNGIELLTIVRKKHPFLPFIIFTGKGREEVVIEAFEKGADFYLQKGGALKPQFAELVHKIHAAVDHRRAEARVTTLDRLYTVLSATNKAIVLIRDKKELLSEICRVAVDIGGFSMAWAGLVNTNTHIIEPIAVQGHIYGFLDTITISTENKPGGRGPTGTAFREKKYQICNDISLDPRMKQIKKEALKRDYRSLAAFPFALNTANAGVITFYASVPGFFDDQIIQLLDEQSKNISFALKTLDEKKQQVVVKTALDEKTIELDRFFTVSLDMLCIVDTDGWFHELNPAWEKILGYRKDELMTHQFLDFVHPDDLQITKEAIAKLKNHEEILHFTNRYRCRDGSYRQMEWQASPHGSIIYADARDVTDRNATERSLRESEQKFRSLVEHALEGILILDLQGTILFANNAAARTIEADGGVSLTGRNVMEFIAPESREDVARDFVQVAHGNDAYLAQYNAISAKGRKITAECVGKMISYEGHPADLISIKDITEQKRAKEALMQSEELHRSLILASPDAIIQVNLEGVITYASPRALEIFDLASIDEATGTDIMNWISSDERSKAQEIFSKVLSGATVQYDVYHFRRKDGTRFYIEINGSTLYGSDGSVKGMVAVLRDVTDRKRAEDALRQMNRQLNLMGSITRHDILNQLLALEGYIELSGDVIDDKQASLLDFIKKEGDIVRTIRHQISFTKEYEGMGVKDPVWQNVNACVKRAVMSLPMRDVHVNVDPDGLECFADPLFEKVFYNLIDNALRYGGAGMKTVRVFVQEADNGCAIICEDDGTGISADDKTRIFTRGFGKHTGLGLFLAREILSITGMTINETSEPGKGARFEIFVPKGAYRFGDEGK